MLFKKYTVETEINGNTVNVEISIQVEEDNIGPEGEFGFGSEEENKKYLERFHRNELFVGCIFVTASAFGLEGVDSMGDCHLSSNNMFNSEPFESDVNNILSYYNMIENAV